MDRIKLIESPTEKDWLEVKRRALVTIGKKPVNPPTSEWKREILEARHSPSVYQLFRNKDSEMGRCSFWEK